MGISNSSVKLLMIVPSYYGWSGDAVNERELSFALSRHVKYVYIIALVGLKQILTKRREELKIDLRRNMKVIPIPMPYPPKFIIPLIMILYSFLIITPIAIVLKKSNMINAVYIRNSLLAVGPIAFKKRFKNLATVIPSLVGDELTSRMKNKLLKSLIKSLCDKIDQFVIERTDILLTHGWTLAEVLMQKYKCIKNKCLLSVGPGVDLRKIRVLRKQIKPVKELRVGFIGSLSWWQGVDILVKAMKIVQKTRPDVRLYIVGGGSELKFIKGMVEKLAVNATLTGPIPHNDALKLLGTFYVLVIPSRKAFNTETKIPVKMVEAFAMGIPVLITNHKVIISHFKNEYDVLYIDDLSPIGVAKKILMLIENPDLRERLSKNSLRFAREFDYNKMAEKLKDAYEKFMNQK